MELPHHVAAFSQLRSDCVENPGPQPPSQHPLGTVLLLLLLRLGTILVGDVHTAVGDCNSNFQWLLAAAVENGARIKI